MLDAVGSGFPALAFETHLEHRVEQEVRAQADRDSIVGVNDVRVASSDAPIPSAGECPYIKRLITGIRPVEITALGKALLNACPVSSERD